MSTRTGSRRVVVGVDGSPQSRTALEWAAAEAHRCGGDVDAVLVYGSGLAWIDVGSDAEPLIVTRSAERAKATLHEVIAAADLPPEDEVRINPIVVMGDPWWALCEIARDAERLVVGTRGHGGFTGLLFGSVSQRCAERSPCAVVVVPSEHPSPHPGSGPRRIVVGVDGSPEALDALTWALRDSRPDDEVDVVLAYEPGTHWVVLGPDVEATLSTAAAQHADTAVHHALRQVAPPDEAATPSAQALRGEPWRVLTAVAADADLLVVGRRGRGGFAGLLLGSVSQRCAERSPCPVVVVPPAQRDEQGAGA